MRGFIGFCLLTAGLSIGAYSHYPGAAHRQANLIELTEIVTGAKHSHAPSPRLIDAARAEQHTRNQVSSKTPATPMAHRLAFANPMLVREAKSAFNLRVGRMAQAETQLVRPPTRVVRKHAAETRPLTIAKPAPVVVAAKTNAARHPQGWRTAVVPAATTSRSEMGQASLKPKTYAERWKLAKALQRELKRVGCYWGKIDGVWGKGSKWAMADFMNAVNAALPAKDPDYLLLRLVTSHQNTICGRQKDNGTQIAVRARKPWTAQVAAAAPTTSTRIITGSTRRRDGRNQKVRPAPLPGRMAVGALNREPRPVLVAPPARVFGSEDQESVRAARKRVRISALPTAAPRPTRDGRTASDGDPLALRAPSSEPHNWIDDAPQRVIVEPRPSAKKLSRDRALRRAAIKKKKRKRYRRSYRRRSIQTLFMHPLGRR